MKSSFIMSLFLWTSVCLLPWSVFSAERLQIDHPLKGGHTYSEKARCDNCGMDLNKWARTRHEFTTQKGKFHTCSIHCVAVLEKKLNDPPGQVRAAEYLKPERMLDAEKAVYVIGSTAPGTMTRKSKIAFHDRKEAEQFAARYGGTAGNFAEALAEARREIEGP